MEVQWLRAGAVGAASQPVGLQAVAAAAAMAMRATADLSDKILQSRDGYAATSAPSSVATSASGDGVDEAEVQVRRSVDVLDVMLDSDMSWGFVREIQQVCSFFLVQILNITSVHSCCWQNAPCSLIQFQSMRHSCTAGVALGPIREQKQLLLLKADAVKDVRVCRVV
jgi:hypothetical protein